jgi:uncharacterized protein YjiS (DUF1127 family)
MGVSTGGISLVGGRAQEIARREEIRGEFMAGKTLNSLMDLITTFNLKRLNPAPISLRRGRADSRRVANSTADKRPGKGRIMSMAAKLESYGASPRPGAALLRLATPGAQRGVMGRLRLAWRQRQARHELEGLDDRMLRDIGVSRGEIGHVVRFGRSPY